MKNLQWERLNIQIPVLTHFHAACEKNGKVWIHG